MRSIFFTILIGLISVSCFTQFEGRSDGLTEEEFDDVVPPSQVTGSQLLSFENRCGFKDLGLKKYQTKCDLVAIQPNGQEVRVDKVTANIELSWQQPQVLNTANAANISITCKAGNDSFIEIPIPEPVTGSGTPVPTPSPVSGYTNNGLSQVCDVTISAGGAEIEFNLDISDNLVNQAKVASDKVLLPYSVGVAAGLVMSIPNQFAKEAKDKKELGFQPLSFEGKDAKFYGESMCTLGDRIYFAHRGKRYRPADSIEADELVGFVFESRDGKVSNYVGAGFGAVKDNLSHRLKVKLGVELYLACDKNSLYISDKRNFRILKVFPDGSVVEVVNLAQEKTAISRLAVDKNEALYFVTAAGISKLDDKGKISKVVDTKDIWDIDFFKKQLVFSVPTTNKVYSVDAAGVINKLAELSSPKSLHLTQQGELLIGEGKNNNTEKAEIKRISRQGAMETFLVNPYGDTKDISSDSQGNVSLLSNTAYHPDLISIQTQSGFKELVGRNKPRLMMEPVQAAKSAQLGRPHGLAINKKGEIFYIEIGSKSLRKVGIDGLVTLIAELAGHIDLNFEDLYALTLMSDGTALVGIGGTSSKGDNRLLKVTSAGVVTRLEIKFKDANIKLGIPGALYTHSNGDIYIAEISRGSKVSKVDKETGEYKVIYKFDSFTPASGLYVKDDNHFYYTNYDGGVGEIKNSRPTNFGKELSFRSLKTARGLISDEKNNLYIADFLNAKIRRVSLEATQPKMETFFGEKNTSKKCGSGMINNAAERSALDSEVQVSLAKICTGFEMASIASYNGCAEAETKDRVFRMAFAQKFANNSFNIIQITKACE